jgi:outer membrane receptor protein involved in Fe transport
MVSQLEIITGTFNAEYGAAQSGVVNIVTKILLNNFGTASLY